MILAKTSSLMPTGALEGGPEESDIVVGLSSGVESTAGKSGRAVCKLPIALEVSISGGIAGTGLPSDCLRLLMMIEWSCVERNCSSTVVDVKMEGGVL